MRDDIQTKSAAVLAILVLATGAVLSAQQAATSSAAAAPAPAESFSTEQLEQLVAPIALHPDALLMQILMASTYPLEVVEADRWLEEHANLEGKALEEALKDEEWDPSVKSLCTLPDVLEMMSDNLDWCQDLGDAFLGQKDQLLDTVQRMRGKAQEAGNLETTEQQVVTVKEDKIIVIESPSPEVVYVPSYSPTVVYGGWSYPSYYYPPMYPYYPPGAGLISFGIGMAVGGAIWGDCNWGWGHHDVDIDVDRYNNFNRNTNINADRTNLSGDRSSWQHDASHRKGVNYQNQQVASKFGAQSGSNRVARDQARGRSGTGTTAGTREVRTPSEGRGTGTRPSTADRGTGTRPSTGDRGTGTRPSTADRGTGTRPSTSDRGTGTGQRPSASTGAGSGSRDRSSTTSRPSPSTSRSSSAYSGSSRPSADRAASSRGSMSRGTSSYGGSRGSMSRGGGSRGGGRGGRGRG